MTNEQKKKKTLQGGAGTNSLDQTNDSKEKPENSHRRSIILNEKRRSDEGRGRTHPTLRGWAPVHAEGERRGPIMAVTRGAVPGHAALPRRDRGRKETRRDAAEQSDHASGTDPGAATDASTKDNATNCPPFDSSALSFFFFFFFYVHFRYFS